MSNIDFILKRADDETWEECAIRHGKEYSLEKEVKGSYELFLKQGLDEAHAALHSCYEWDVLPLRKTLEKVIQSNI